LVVRVGCARTPSLISVRDPGVRIGDMMVDGVIRDAVRPLCLKRKSLKRKSLWSASSPFREGDGVAEAFELGDERRVVRAGSRRV
jgi:hypothetical protein